MPGQLFFAGLSKPVQSIPMRALRRALLLAAVLVAPSCTKSTSAEEKAIIFKVGDVIGKKETDGKEKFLRAKVLEIADSGVKIELMARNNESDPKEGYILDTLVLAYNSSKPIGLEGLNFTVQPVKKLPDGSAEIKYSFK